MFIPLKVLIDTLEEDELNKVLSSFSCSKDDDIEKFLKERAVLFEGLSKARTYLIFDEEELQTKNIASVKVCGYVSLAMKILKLSKDVSNQVRKEYDGYNAKLRGRVQEEFPCYLIGQLGRNSSISSDNLTGCRLLEFALDVVQFAVDAVGGRLVMVECSPIECLKNFYITNGFEEIADVPDDGKDMVQMVRMI